MKEAVAEAQVDYLVNAIRRVEAEIHARQRSAQLRLERAKAPARRSRQRGEAWAFSMSRGKIQDALWDFATFQMRSHRGEG